MRLALFVAVGLAVLAVSPPAWAAGPAPGLVAAYAFDEVSGATAVDATGNGNNGAVVGATWVTGRYGGGLLFDGSNDYVGLPALGTFYNTAFTLEAWVLKATTKNDVGIVGTWTGSGPMLWVDHLASRYHLTLGSSMSTYLDSGLNPVVGQWQHLAATSDGTTARFYVNGTQVSSRAVSGSVGSSNTWRIGAYGSGPGNFFDGVLDEIRVYDRALSAAEVQADRDQPLGITNPGAPTAPGNLTATGSTQTSISLGWTASTDDTGVSGYNVYVDGAAAGTTAATSFTVPGLTCSTGYSIEVEAFDGSANVSPRALVDTSTATCDTSSGLVAAYAFDDGSGTAAADASGNGHTGAISGAAWATGRHGGGLFFDGSNDYVALGALGTFYNAGFTLEAWVQKSSAKKDVGVLGTWAGNGPMLWVDHVAGHNYLTLGGSFSSYLDSGQSPAAGQWQHLAATFDGATARYYIDGAEVASRAFSGSVGSSNTWRVGAYGGSPGNFLDGFVDDVRVYNRALTAGEIQFDRDHGVSTADTSPPTQPGTLVATGGLGQANLSWGAATDNVAVVEYNVHRSTSSGFTPSPANKIAEPTGTTYADSGLSAGTYYYKVTAEDGAGNVGPASNQASAAVTADTTPPTVSITAPTAGSTVAGVTTVSANAADNVAVAGVQFRSDGTNLGAEDLTAPYTIQWDTRGEVNGGHVLTAVARDTSGNLATSSPVSVTVANAGVSPAGLQVAYALNESSGVLAYDASDHGLAATAVGTTWTGGHYDGGISLDGVSSRVDIPPLGTFYTAGFTYEAWVRKQTSKKDVGVVGTWSANQGGGAMIWVDYSSGRYMLTLGNNSGNYLDSGRSPTVGQWEHVAATYDGSTARFYVGGAQVASKAFTGSLGSSSTWRLGAYNGSPTGFFDGLLDNVRIYNRALSPAEIQTDMVTPIEGETTPPTVTATTPVAGAADLNVGTSPTARFSEPMDAATITSSTFQLKGPGNVVVPATATYDATTRTATLTPQGVLAYGTTYTATVQGGAGGVTDGAGNALVSNVSWSFTTEVSPPQMLVVTSTANPFGSYLGEILRNEGLNAFTTIDVAFLSPALLTGFDVVLLGEGHAECLAGLDADRLGQRWRQPGRDATGSAACRTARADLGRRDALKRLPEGEHDSATGSGHRGRDDAVPRHGRPLCPERCDGGRHPVFERRRLRRPIPAVTLRSVGSSGGQAAAFAFDLARSVVYTRQGNPAWAGQERDGVVGIRSSDLFYGAKAGDVQPDWIDTSKIAIPQADEQQRLLANLITLMNSDKEPLPRFWYLPRGEKAVVVMSGDDHAPAARPTTSTASRRSARPGVSSPTGSASARPPTSTRAPPSPTPRPSPTTPRASRSRFIPSTSPARLRRSPRPRSQQSSTPSSASSRASTPASPCRSRAAPTASSGPTGSRLRRSSSPMGSGWTRTTITTPQPGSGETRLRQRRRLPDALRRTGRNGDRRLPGEHEHDRRRRTGLPVDGRRPARQRHRSAGLLRRVRREHAHRQRHSPSRRRRNRRLRASAKRAGHLLQAAAHVDRRTQQLHHPRPQLERRNPHLHHFRCRRRERPADDGARPGALRNAERDHARRLARRLRRPDDQGHPVRILHRRERDVPGDVLVSLAGGSPRLGDRNQALARGLC